MPVVTHTKKEIRVVGIQRSGNHAIINWIIKQSGEDVLFFNDVEPENPFEITRLFASDKTNKTKDSYDCVVYSYEDRILNVVAHKMYYPQNNTYNIKVGKRFDVIILRNPFNAFASRMKHAAVSVTMSTYISGLNLPQLWVTHANEFLMKTSHLKNNKVCINYDLWCFSTEYRKSIADSLELDFTDEGFDELTSYGQGSSFDLTKYDARASEMTTDQRWKKFSEMDAYVGLFDDRLLISLVKKIFRLDQNLEKFINEKIIPKQSWHSSLLRKAKIAFLPAVIANARESKIIRYIYFSIIQPIRKRKIHNSS